MIIAIAIILIASTYYYLSNNSNLLQPQILSAHISNFLKSFGPTNLLPLSNVTSGCGIATPNPNNCTILITTASYLGKNFSIINPVNFSNINTTEPFFEYVTVAVFNQSYAPIARKTLYANRGIIYPPRFSSLIPNSTYFSTNITIDGSSSYILKFSNLTPSAMGSIAKYTGQAPRNIDYFIVVSIYKDTYIEVGDEGFSQSMNVSRLVSIESKLLQQMKKLQ